MMTDGMSQFFPEEFFFPVVKTDSDRKFANFIFIVNINMTQSFVQ